MDQITITISMTRDEAIDMMGELMREISQDAYLAAWMDGIEDEIPPLVEAVLSSGQNQKYNWGEVTVMQAKKLKALADQLGHWVDDDGEPYTPKLDQ